MSWIVGEKAWKSKNKKIKESEKVQENVLEEREADVELNGGEKVESEWGTDKKPASVFTIRWIKEEQK